MNAVNEQSFEGDELVIVKFERESPESSAPLIEVVFRVHEPQGVIHRTRAVLVQLSATRQDTHEPVTLTREEQDAVLTKAAEKANDLMPGE